MSEKGYSQAQVPDWKRKKTLKIVNKFKKLLQNMQKNVDANLAQKEAALSDFALSCT